ncbi:MAG: alpha/beta fold hydrolase [Pseudomonadota bacterium]|nr:alpha/beta fold hydrolase [Pseudomonadota bacterium]
MNIVIFFGFALCLLAAVFIAIRSYRDALADFVRTPSTEISRHPERTSIAGLREICLSAPGEARLAGWYAPSSNRAAIVLIHGTGADRSSLLFETGVLADSGFGVLALDLPGQGASEGQSSWGGAERLAIMAAVGWLAAREEVDPQRIGGLGLSMGAYVLAQSAVLDHRLRAVVLAGCPTDVVEQNWVASKKWGWLSQLPTYWALRASRMPLDMLPKDVVGAIAPRPIFIVGGEFDRVVPAYMARQLFAAAREPKLLWVVPRAQHVDYARIAAQEYGLRLTEFFGHALLTSEPSQL